MVGVHGHGMTGSSQALGRCVEVAGIIQDTESSHRRHKHFTATILAATTASTLLRGHCCNREGLATEHSIRPFHISWQTSLGTQVEENSFSFAFCVQLTQRRPHELCNIGSTWAIAYKKTIAPFLVVLNAYRLPTGELSLTSCFPQRPHIVLSKEHHTFKLLSLCRVRLYNLAIEFNGTKVPQKMKDTCLENPLLQSDRPLLQLSLPPVGFDLFT